MKNLNITHLFVIIIISITSALAIAATIKSVSYAYDRDTFTALDSKMKMVYKNIINNSDLSWAYKTGCNAERKGAWPTGRYNCSSAISANAEVGSVAQINNLNNKYLKIVNDSGIFNSKNELKHSSFDGFGKDFVISSEENSYIETKSNIECTYLFKVENIENNPANSIYGSMIENDRGIADISLSCTGIAMDYWYELSDKSELPKPDAPMKRS